MLLIENALVVDGNGSPYRGWLTAEGDTISAMGSGDVPAEIAACASEGIDADGRLLMPGAIDAHVHFREPGLTHKATIASESRAARAGGVTSWIEMPNTRPATTTLALWEEKMEIAARDSLTNYSFMLGATDSNIDELRRADLALTPAVKVFMGSSTGNMLLDGDAPLRRVFAEQGARVVVHAEDQGVIDANTARFAPIDNPSDMMWHTRIRSAEACVRATERALELATRYGTRLHVAHLTTALETRLFDPAELPLGKQFTAEVSPHHLIFSSDDYSRLGSRIKMNPAVKSAADRAALRQALAEGRIDIVATDHAPHLLSEKQGDVFTAVSGAPMVQFSLQAMLTLTDDPSFVARRMSAAPAALFGIADRGVLAPGKKADMVLVERLDEAHIVSDADVISLCGWTPMAGSRLSYAVVRTWVNGCDNATPEAAQPLRFNA